jgi:protocatechuate 3,4-dioxygenase alpha subunit
MSLKASTSQTVGPFFSIGLSWLTTDGLAGSGISGERIRIQGRVVDGDENPVPDALLEFWQADDQGSYAQGGDEHDKRRVEGFKGFGRVATDEDGRFSFATIKPGSVPGPDGKTQAPHIAVSVFARGLLRRLVTRIYFPDDAGNAHDFVLNLVEPARRGTLVAKRAAGQSGAFEWDVILQGDDETVFFDIGL